MTLVRCELAEPMTLAAAALAAAIVAGSSAQAASVKEIFEKNGLLGTFAWDCSKPASGDNNWYYVNRMMDADHVQRDFMTGAATRAWYIIIDKAEERSANQIYASGTYVGGDGQKPTDGLWRVEQNRMLQVEATLGGKKIISDSKWVETGKEMPWLNRCSS